MTTKVATIGMLVVIAFVYDENEKYDQVYVLTRQLRKKWIVQDRTSFFGFKCKKTKNIRTNLTGRLALTLALFWPSKD